MAWSFSSWRNICLDLTPRRWSGRPGFRPPVQKEAFVCYWSIYKLFFFKKKRKKHLRTAKFKALFPCSGSAVICEALNRAKSREQCSYIRIKGQTLTESCTATEKTPCVTVSSGSQMTNSAARAKAGMLQFGRSLQAAASYSYSPKGAVSRGNYLRVPCESIDVFF